MTGSAWAVVTLSAILALLSLAGCLVLQRRLGELRELVLALMPETGESDDLPVPGRRVAPFAAVTTGGDPVEETGLAGTTVLVGFFLVGCSMCHSQVAPFGKFADHPLAPERTLAVVVGVGSGGDGGYVAELEPHADVLADGRAAEVATAFGVAGYPAFCLVRDGVVEIAAHSMDDLERQLEAVVSRA